MEIVIKGGKPTDWYSSHVGIRYNVIAKPNGSDYYLIDKPNHGMLMVNKNDCEEISSELFCEQVPKKDAHYDNTHGSLYKFAEEHGLNAYEFDILKRTIRCRKKGQFKEDLEKTKRVIDLYLKEYESTKLI